LNPQQEAKLQYDADRLYRRFRQSDQYVKYRARQSKDDKGNGDQKWPDELEKAFFRGLSRILCSHASG
jgi:transcriptional enhancer factor